MRRSFWMALLCTLGTLPAAGCLFSVQHEIPENAYFGRLPHEREAKSVEFREESRKNWALAGLLPYSGFDSGDLLSTRTNGGSTHIEDLSIETRFDTLDTVIWVVPGFFYGYYLWAPRSVGVSGTLVDEGSSAR